MCDAQWMCDRSLVSNGRCNVIVIERIIHLVCFCYLFSLCFVVITQFDVKKSTKDQITQMKCLHFIVGALFIHCSGRLHDNIQCDARKWCQCDKLSLIFFLMWQKEAIFIHSNFLHVNAHLSCSSFVNGLINEHKIEEIAINPMRWRKSPSIGQTKEMQRHTARFLSNQHGFSGEQNVDSIFCHFVSWARC